MLQRINDELQKQIEDAVRLHGHLGPFLVVGVRMGRLANEKLKPDHSGHGNLKAHVKVPLRPPYSCILDGIQSTTQCTIGNGKLSFEKSKMIGAEFKLQGSDAILHITVEPRFVETPIQQIKTGVSLDLLSEHAASMEEEGLFRVGPK